MPNPTQTTDLERRKALSKRLIGEVVQEAAEAYGRDAWSNGVGIEGARAYSDRLDVQQAWQIGWMAAENEHRKRSAVYGAAWLLARDIGAVWCRSCGYRGSVLGSPTIGQPCARCGATVQEQSP